MPSAEQHDVIYLYLELMDKRRKKENNKQAFKLSF